MTLVLQVDLLELLCCGDLNRPPIYVIHEKFWPRNWSGLLIQVQFSCFPESILLVVIIHHLGEVCIRDKPLCEIVWNHQCLLSWNIVPLQQHVQILLPNRIDSLCFLVKVIWFVLRTVAIEFDDVKGSRSAKELLPEFHREQLIVPSIHQVAPIYLDGFQNFHTCLQLLRKDWADWQKTIMRQTVSIVG